MSKKKKIKFEYLKEELEKAFGPISNDMVEELQAFCAAFPDFMAFFNKQLCMNINVAVEIYMKMMKNNSQKKCKKLLKQEKPKNSLLYWLLSGLFFIDAYKQSIDNCGVDYTEQYFRLKKHPAMKKKFNF